MDCSGTMSRGTKDSTTEGHTMTITNLSVEEDPALSASAWLERTYDAKAHLIAVFHDGRRFLTADELAFLATPPGVWTPYTTGHAPQTADAAA
jgi:hypothetical protein